MSSFDDVSEYPAEYFLNVRLERYQEFIAVTVNYVIVRGHSPKVKRADFVQSTQSQPWTINLL